LKNIALQRFPGSRFFHEEFIEGFDGKARYFRTLRVEMYRHLFLQLQRYAAPQTCIYLCMENNDIWRDVFGFTPDERGGLAAMLDRAVGRAA
jgi:spore photoproduct lyase